VNECCPRLPPASALCPLPTHPTSLTLPPPSLPTAEVIDLINDEAKALDEEGELELNFEKATQEALQQMDLWFKRKAAPQLPARSAEVLSGRRGGSVRLEVDSDSDPESDNDSDDYNSDDD
jgi:hypothetical protein